MSDEENGRVPRAARALYTPFRPYLQRNTRARSAGSRTRAQELSLPFAPRTALTQITKPVQTKTKHCVRFYYRARTVLDSSTAIHNALDSQLRLGRGKPKAFGGSGVQSRLQEQPAREEEAAAASQLSLVKPTVSTSPVASVHVFPTNSSISSGIAGVLLYRLIAKATPPSPLFETPGSLQALRSNADPALPPRSNPHHIPSRPPERPFSSSFSSVITQNHVVTIHLPITFLTAKSLLGSHSSSATMPGMFEWVEGALVQPMQAGKGLVFKRTTKQVWPDTCKLIQEVLKTSPKASGSVPGARPDVVPLD